MRSLHPAARVCTTVLLASSVLAVASLGTGLAFSWWRVVPVRSGSMAPAIPTGALVLATPETFGQLDAGQVIIYDPPTAGDDLLVHRVASVDRDGPRPVVRTWGDANAGLDPWTAELQHPPVWRARLVVPNLGTAVEVVRNGTVRLVLYGIALAGMATALVTSLADLRRRAAEDRRTVSRPG